MLIKLIKRVKEEEERGIAKWGATDNNPNILLNAAVEELGEVAHAINHSEGIEKIQQEITETIGVLSRLYNMVGWLSKEAKRDEQKAN